MTVPYYVNEHNRKFGRLSLDGAMASFPPVRIQTRGNASPESFAHRPGCGGPLSVPNVEASTSGRALA